MTSAVGPSSTDWSMFAATLNESFYLVHVELSDGSSRVDQLGAIEIPIALLLIQMRVDVVKRHDAVGVGQQSMVDGIESNSESA